QARKPAADRRGGSVLRGDAGLGGGVVALSGAASRASPGRDDAGPALHGPDRECGGGGLRHPRGLGGGARTGTGGVATPLGTAAAAAPRRAPRPPARRRRPATRA